MAPVIRVDGLSKTYRTPKRYPGRFGALRSLVSTERELVHAVTDVSFDVQPGELVGYLGPNGAGKSTTIKMMTGVLVPSGGVLEVNGLVPWRERERNALQIGVVFGQRTQLWWDLPLVESFKLVGKLYRMPPADYRRNVDRLVDMLGIGAFLHRPVRQLSLGQRMLGDLAASMLYEPPLLYLDEPTIGLDAVAKERMRGFVEQLNRESGTTIVLTTHDLPDVERLCDRVILIDHGRVLYDGGVEQLKSRLAPHRTLVVRLAPDETGRVPHVSAADLPHGAVIEQDAAVARISFEPTRLSAQELIAAVNTGYRVVDLALVEPDLEGVVRGLYEHSGALR